MRLKDLHILLKEHLKWRLGRVLLGLEAESVQNGVLLKKAEVSGFEGAHQLITLDSNMVFQLNRR